MGCDATHIMGTMWYDVEPMVALFAGGSAMSFGDFIDSGALPTVL